MIFGSKKKDTPLPPVHPGGTTIPAPTATPPAKSAASQSGRDTAGKSQSGVSQEEAQRRAAAAVRHSLAFAQIVSLLMHSSRYKHYTLADLEWLVLPPLLSGQCGVAEAKSKENGVSIPVAVALWASVSPEVDRRLSENLAAPVRLRPDEWRSGDILWLVDAIGDRRVIPGFLKQLSENTFKGRTVKIRGRGSDGKPVIQSLDAAIKTAPAPAPTEQRTR
jgi:hemolysin-activating ACP:hemolysin acyltransferase